jgi:membrane fusion protein (multidrug efflux system)
MRASPPNDLGGQPRSGPAGRPCRAEGDVVRRGQVLAEIYAQNASLTTSAQEASLRSAEAEVLRLDHLIVETRASTQAALSEARSQLATAGLALEQARLNTANARADYERDLDLVFVSGQHMQHSATAYKIAQREAKATSEESAAKAGVAKAEAVARLDSLTAQAQRARADAESLRSRLGLARLDLRDLRLVRLLDGVVDRTFANTGDYLGAGQRVLLLHDPEAVWVEANVKETDREN